MPTQQLKFFHETLYSECNILTQNLGAWKRPVSERNRMRSITEIIYHMLQSGTVCDRLNT